MRKFKHIRRVCSGDVLALGNRGRWLYGGAIMCLAIPGRVLTIDEGDALYRTGEVDFNGARKRVGLGMVPEVCLGQYVLVHVGVALQVVDEAEAATIWGYLEALGETADFAAAAAPPIGGKAISSGEMS